MQLDSRDLVVETMRGTGPGGQHRNVTDSAVRITHRPSGLKVMIDSKHQSQNKKLAIQILTAKVNERMLEKQDQKYNENRKQQLGGGGRSNKIRTYNFMKSRVVDHRRGTKTKQIKQIMKGRFDLLDKSGS